MRHACLCTYRMESQLSCVQSLDELFLSKFVYCLWQLVFVFLVIGVTLVDVNFTHFHLLQNDCPTGPISIKLSTKHSRMWNSSVLGKGSSYVNKKANCWVFRIFFHRTIFNQTWHNESWGEGKSIFFQMKFHTPFYEQIHAQEIAIQ